MKRQLRLYAHGRNKSVYTYNMKQTSASITPGRYKHYKGQQYEVIGIGKDTETEEDVVIYQPLYESDVVYWVRPRKMFEDTVAINGRTIRRFERVHDENE